MNYFFYIFPNAIRRESHKSFKESYFHIMKIIKLDFNTVTDVNGRKTFLVFFS